MPKFVMRANVGSVLRGLRVRSERAYEAANSGAYEISEVLVSILHSSGALPGKVAASLDTEVFARSGGRLLGVRVRAVGKYYDWYVYGTRPHAIYPVEAAVLAFWWERAGEFVHFAYIDRPVGVEPKLAHPGARPHPEAAEIARKALHDIAMGIWTDRLREAMSGSF